MLVISNTLLYKGEYVNKKCNLGGINYPHTPKVRNFVFLTIGRYITDIFLGVVKYSGCLVVSDIITICLYVFDSQFINYLNIIKIRNHRINVFFTIQNLKFNFKELGYVTGLPMYHKFQNHKYDRLGYVSLAHIS